MNKGLRSVLLFGILTKLAKVHNSNCTTCTVKLFLKLSLACQFTATVKRLKTSFHRMIKGHQLQTTTIQLLLELKS